MSNNIDLKVQLSTNSTILSTT